MPAARCETAWAAVSISVNFFSSSINLALIAWISLVSSPSLPLAHSTNLSMSSFRAPARSSESVSSFWLSLASGSTL
ncbi:hypothetical protein BDV35DRAFT_339788 [Aspergillus flavus]|uniref:Uncharacterized protein n=1 Tax=Aspergillus flavus TaxID=5059 RepID=A0A5N6HA62_ASPFL|nr:hypothetical protein BDV35DRAFT_339788 [Aspergillus flavus]